MMRAAGSRAQLAAFRRNDFDTADTFASSMIRAMFDRQDFERMVRTGYPEIARSAAAAGRRPNAAS